MNSATNERPAADILPQEYLVELGRICEKWSTLESAIDICLAALTGLATRDARSFILFTHMSMPLKLDVMAALCSQLEPRKPRLKGYKDTIGQVKKAQKSRNKFIHAKWSIDEETGAVKNPHVTARGSVRASVDEVRVEEIRRTVSSIQQAIIALYDLVIGDAGSGTT